MNRYRNMRGNTAPITGSPMRSRAPDGAPGGGAAPVRVVQGFTTTLPGRTTRFFQRSFFANYPRPIQQGGTPPFPRRVPIAKIEVPNQQSLVLRNVKFSAYQHSGIGVEDLSEVPSGRAVGTLGFEFLMGNQGLSDYETNLPGRGVPVLYTAAQGSTPTAPRAGQGSIFQGTGTMTPDPSTNGANFAAYGMPGQSIVANAVIFNPPSYDLRLFRVEFSGWITEQKHLESIIDSLSR